MAAWLTGIGRIFRQPVRAGKPQSSWSGFLGAVAERCGRKQLGRRPSSKIWETRCWLIMWKYTIDVWNSMKRNKWSIESAERTESLWRGVSIQMQLMVGTQMTKGLQTPQHLEHGRVFATFPSQFQSLMWLVNHQSLSKDVGGNDFRNWECTSEGTQPRDDACCCYCCYLRQRRLWKKNVKCWSSHFGSIGNLGNLGLGISFCLTNPHSCWRLSISRKGEVWLSDSHSTVTVSMDTSFSWLHWGNKRTPGCRLSLINLENVSTF